MLSVHNGNGRFRARSREGLQEQAPHHYGGPSLLLRRGNQSCYVRHPGGQPIDFAGRRTARARQFTHNMRESAKRHYRAAWPASKAQSMELIELTTTKLTREKSASDAAPRSHSGVNSIRGSLLLPA